MNMMDEYRKALVITELTNYTHNIFPYLGEKRNITPIKVETKPGRNELCPCGSGLKYKKCCGLNKVGGGK
jgi:uncharacterized protein YecA (UPF0149 family)